MSDQGDQTKAVRRRRPARDRPVRCPSCGTANRADARWCSNCAQPLGQAATAPNGGSRPTTPPPVTPAASPPTRALRLPRAGPTTPPHDAVPGSPPLRPARRRCDDAISDVRHRRPLRRHRHHARRGTATLDARADHARARRTARSPAAARPPVPRSNLNPLLADRDRRPAHHDRDLRPHGARAERRADQDGEHAARRGGQRRRGDPRALVPFHREPADVQVPDGRCRLRPRAARRDERVLAHVRWRRSAGST